jgi:spermidine synthase
VRAGEPLAALAASPLQQALLAVGALGVPSLLVAAVIFPLTFRLVSAGPAGPRLGGLLAINTLGGIAGSLAASFAMLEWLGLWGSFAALGLVYGAAALAVANTPRQRLATAATVALGVAAVAALPANPWRMASAQPRDGERLLAQTEGAHGLVSVLERDGDRYVAIDQHYRFGSTRSAELYERMGRLPLLLHPDPRRVLVVGSATGGLAAAAVLHPVDEIGLVEIVPEMHALAAAHFAAFNRGVHTDPRTRLITEDGRNHLRAAAERYDVVIEDLFVPQRPTAAAMYTGEHYRDVRAHLSESGVFCQWLPIYQLSRTQLAMIVATFIDVFPDAALWTPSFRQPPILGLVASAGGLPSVEALAARGQQLERSGIEDGWLNDPDGLWAFYLGPAASLAEVAPAAALNSDAWPLFEFVSARTPTIQSGRFASGGWPRLVGELLARADAEDPLFPGRPLALARAGQELARLNLLARSARSSLSREAWHQIEAQLPARLLARRDPSVSNVWPDESR